MIQKSLFDAVATDAKVGQDLLEIIEKSVHRIGLKEFAFLINKESSHVRDALSGNGKHFAAQWVATLLARDKYFVLEYATYIAENFGLEHPQERKTLTPEEKLRKYEEIIAIKGISSLFEGVN